jgi:hypothetical protein
VRHEQRVSLVDRVAAASNKAKLPKDRHVTPGDPSPADLALCWRCRAGCSSTRLRAGHVVAFALAILERLAASLAGVVAPPEEATKPARLGLSDVRHIPLKQVTHRRC